MSVLTRASLVCAAVLAAAPAFAQTTTVGQGRLDMEGTAPSTCLVQSPQSAVGTNTTFSSGNAQQGQVTITELADPQTAVAKQATISVALPAICNTAHHVTVTSLNRGLLRQGGVASQTPVNGFREFIPYSVTASWAGQTATGQSLTGTPVNITTQDGAAGQVSLTIDVPGGGDPLVAGTYSDSLTIELQVAS
ncbi:hypothetical protein ACO2Q3_19320 [Caulobacter sp. KR2-114]|uniref:hypothetical protein n=1 Tax=Caulobacter sp. KR2-114 TaxID=3400912 RepID=UPI003C0B4889